MPNSRFGYSVKKNSFKGLNIDCIQYLNIIRITYYSYSYSGTILNPNIICIRIRPNICARILFVFVFAHSEKTDIIRVCIRSKFWFRIIFVFVFGPKNSIRSPLIYTFSFPDFICQEIAEFPHYPILDLPCIAWETRWPLSVFCKAFTQLILGYPCILPQTNSIKAGQKIVIQSNSVKRIT